MSPWKLHTLAGDQREQLAMRYGQKCRSTVDLPGVPAGTEGVVTEAKGISWLRYRVKFETGREHDDLDGRHVEPLSTGKKKKQKK